MGRIPKPAIAVLTNACNTYIKWAEIWERMYHMPVFMLDMPGPRAGRRTPVRGDRGLRARPALRAGPAARADRAAASTVTGKKFDIDRLRENMGHANTMSRGWKRVLELNRSRPSLFNALSDGTIYLGVVQRLPRPRAGRALLRPIWSRRWSTRRDHGIGTLADEKYRLLFVGVPCYPIFRRFNELFTEQGGTFVNSTYLWFASGGTNLGFEYDLADPLESLAEGLLIGVRDAMDSMFFQTQRAGRDDRRLTPPTASSTTRSRAAARVSTGLADNRRALMELRDIPSLFIESDMMDRRVVSEAQLKNRIDAFFEGLAIAPPAGRGRHRLSEEARPWHTQQAWTSGPRRPRRSSSTRQGRIVGRALTMTGANVIRAAENAFAEALTDGDVREEEVEYVVGTGYGRYKVTFGNTQVTEISCHGRGAVHMFPSTRTVVDMGGQDTKAIRVSPRGEIVDFCMNDKCAAGTGRFLGAASAALEIPLDELGADRAARRAAGQDQHDLHRVRGVRGAVVARQGQEDRGHPARRAPVDRRALDRPAAARGVEERGHVHRRRGEEHGDDRSRSNEALGLKVNVSEDSHYMGALGAALFALDHILAEPRAGRRASQGTT